MRKGGFALSDWNLVPGGSKVCASQGCENKATWRLDTKSTGSDFCSACKFKIDQIAQDFKDNRL